MMAGLDALLAGLGAARSTPVPARGDAEPLGPAPSGGASFSDQLVALVRSSDALQKSAEGHSESLATGEGDVVETMVALSKAEISLRFVTEVRNRALEAYQEIMRLQV